VYQASGDERIVPIEAPLPEADADECIADVAEATLPDADGPAEALAALRVSGD
jgi:hypothetical protein